MVFLKKAGKCRPTYVWCGVKKERTLKEERNFIRFGRPRHVPSVMDGIEIVYPYEIVFYSKEDLKLPYS